MNQSVCLSVCLPALTTTANLSGSDFSLSQPHLPFREGRGCSLSESVCLSLCLPACPQLCWLARGCCWKSTPDTVLPKYLHYIRLFMVLEISQSFLDFKTSSLELLFSNYQGKPNFAFNISFGTFYTCYLIARINNSIV